MSAPPVTPLVAALPAAVPFTGPEALERRRGRPFRARLGANENSFGPAPAAVAALAEAAAGCWRYGDPECFELRRAIAARRGVGTEQVVVGEGIDGLLGLAARLFLAPGDAAVTSLGAYPTFNYHVAGAGGRLAAAPYRDDAEDPEALVELAAREDARVVYLANPDNPMGSHLAGAEIEEMIARLPPRCALLLDEAYAEFAPDGASPRIAADDPRVIRLRTFSKAHGLAGLRVGYALAAPETARAFDKLRNHFGVNRAGQAAALAALVSDDWLAHVAASVAAARERIAAVAAENGLAALPSAANFVAIDCGGDGAVAQAVLEALAERDVFVRMPGVAPLDRCIRVTAAPDAALDLFAEALPEALAAARGR